MKTLKNKKGFTLMEMLIVIAIMVVLMAIALPAFTTQLDGAKATTDKANLRTAQSVAQTMLVTEDPLLTPAGEATEVTLYYDVDNCVFSATEPSEGYAELRGSEDCYIVLVYNATSETMEVEWSDGYGE